MLLQGNSDGAQIELSRDEWSKNVDATNYYVAKIRIDGLEVCHNVYAFDPANEGLAKFFEELALNWKGWDGIRHWSSLEGEFEIDCKQDGLGNIGTTAKLHKNRGEVSGWTAEIRFEISAGQLDQITCDLKNFFTV